MFKNCVKLFIRLSYKNFDSGTGTDKRVDSFLNYQHQALVPKWFEMLSEVKLV